MNMWQRAGKIHKLQDCRHAPDACLITSQYFAIVVVFRSFISHVLPQLWCICEGGKWRQWVFWNDNKPRESPAEEANDAFWDENFYFQH